MSYRIGPDAQSDIRAITEYIGQHNPAAAQAFAGRLRDRLELLGRTPAMGRARDDLGPELRAFPHGRYLIVYRLEDRTAMIVRIVHGARDAGALLDGER